MENIIEVTDLKKVYSTHEREPGLWNAIKSLFNRHYVTSKAIDGISFSVKKGEIVGLIGPNGAGKSTAIKIMSGVLYPTEGTVKIMNYTPWKDRIEYVKNIGVVFGQKSQLNWDLPAIDTYELNKYLYDIPKAEYTKRLNYMVNMLEATDLVKKPVRDLSLGEHMKCKLISALLHRPKLVFLDEPTIGLDVIAKDIMRDFILEENKKYQTTFIITTHDMQDIENLCKMIIIINHGVIVYDGPIEDIKKEYFQEKILNVKFEEAPKSFKLRGCTVTKQDKYQLTIRVDMKKTNIKNVIDHLIKNHPFADLVINDPPIEEVIQKIYRQ